MRVCAQYAVVIATLNSHCFNVLRDEKVKLLRGIWMTVINIYCKWTFSEGLRDKNGSTQSDLHNIYQLLLYGATDLSSTWNKFQIKSWKSLYSEGVKHFSLLPEADKFVSGLVQLLVDGVRNGKLPFHVAVDVVSILLEFHLSKDASSIRPLMMELAEKGMNLLQIDPSSSILLGTYIKIIVSAARSESALVNDVSAVIDKMSTNSKETLSGGSHDKIRNMVFKAQHQLHGLKSTRIQEKSDSPNTSTTPTSSSPTMTSFLRRLAKSKESKAKLSSTSPSQSLEKSPSPAVTPTSKKTNSPFADLKSEDFVFVPPKNRKTILTDHQKESLNSRKHDIPALYQDLSQDNSQSAFESIVTSVQVVEEDVDKLHFVHTPKKQNGSVELGLKVLTPKEVKNSTSGIEVREPEESKLLSNKENDCFNNNTNSPFSSVGKQDKLVSKDMSSFNTVLPNDDSKKCEDNSLAVVVDGNKPLQEMKNVESKLSDNKKSSNIKTCESTLKEVSKRDKKENEDLKTSVEKSECKKTSEIEPCSKANKTVSESLATETTVNSVIDHKTPKRNFKRSKIILSVKKSQKKDNTKSPKISEEEISLTPDNKERKSPRNSNNTPKVSPRRLRKRKSGVTPILSAGELSKKKKSVQSPLSSKTTPVVKIAECTEIKKAFNEDIEDVNNCNRNKCIGSTNGINSEKPCMVTSEESSTGTKSVVGEECEKTDKISEKLIMKKDNINVDIKFSPVKVVLARIPLNDSSSCSNINNRLCGPSSEKPNKSCGEPVSGRIKDPIKLSDRKNQVDDSTEGLINADTGVDHSKKNSHSVIGNNTETEGSVKEVTTNLKEVRKGDEEISVKCTVATKSNTSEQKTHEDICTNSESKQSAEIDQTPPVKRRYSPLIITRSMETNNKSIDTSHTSGKNYTTTKNVSSGDTSIKVPVECSAAVTTVKSEAENSNDCNKLYDSANKDGKSLLDKESISTPQKSVVELKTNSTAGGNNDMKNSSKESESLCVVESSPSQNTRSSVKKQSADYSDSDIEVIYDAKDNTNKINTGIVESEEIIEEVTPVKEINKLPTSLQNKNNLSKSKIIVDEQQTIEIEKDENSSSMSVVCKHISSSNTPIKSGQKGLKQTQLPFVPVRPSLEANVDKPINLNENGNTICDTTNLKNVTSQMTSASETKEENNLDSITCGVETDKDRETFKAKKEETQLGCEVEGTRINQEAPRTPEKNKPVEESSGLENLKTTDDSLVECKDSEDVIASSQEDEFNTRSFSVLNGPITSSSPLKLPSKSPKKHENASFSQIHLSSERVLRSSPLKVENSRFSGTPIKKSVCRRLDVEISDNQSEVESTEAANGGIAKLKISSSHTEDQTINQPQVTLSRADYSEEFLNDIKLLNGDRKKPDEIYDSGSDKNDDIDKLKLFEKYQPNGISTITSPSSHKTLKRFLLEPTSSTVESSRTTLGSLRLENNVTGSPKSPSSRTNQMMELAMQDKEKTISSPVSSLKKRKINPLRLGPVLKTPLNQRYAVVNNT
ncbi:DNA-binding protein rif1 [Homalodisca vitripennis]|nr:DNA-binding protein rif1 [Homalodisca vitripennis]